jgi:hypothetical protein
MYVCVRRCLLITVPPSIFVFGACSATTLYISKIWWNTLMRMRSYSEPSSAASDVRFYRTKNITTFLLLNT